MIMEKRAVNPNKNTNSTMIYLDNFNMVFQLSGFLIELKLKYYQKIFPDKSVKVLKEIIYQEIVNYKEKELKNAARQYAISNI